MEKMILVITKHNRKLYIVDTDYVKMSSDVIEIKSKIPDKCKYLDLTKCVDIKTIDQKFLHNDLKIRYWQDIAFRDESDFNFPFMRITLIPSNPGI